MVEMVEVSFVLLNACNSWQTEGSTECAARPKAGKAAGRVRLYKNVLCS